MPRRRSLMLCAALAVAFLALPWAARAACRMPLVIGQWQHVTDNSRWAFFSNGKVDCRLCSEWNERGACVYVYDPADEQGRRQCTYQSGAERDHIDPKGRVKVTGWRAKDGQIAALEYSDGTIADVSGCEVNGAKGEISLPDVGTFSCHYHYQCNKLEREAQ